MRSIVRGLIDVVRRSFARTTHGEDNATSSYRSMLERVKAGDLKVDLDEMRQAYADSEDYSSVSDPDLQKEMIEAINKEQFPKAIELAARALEGNYVDINAHHTLYVAYKENREDDKSEFHFAIEKGLIDSILKSGDGKSRETAYVVISTDEEYVVLNVFGLELELQAVQSAEGHWYDILNAKDPDTQEKVELFFNIDKPYGHMAEILQRARKR